MRQVNLTITYDEAWEIERALEHMISDLREYANSMQDDAAAHLNRRRAHKLWELANTIGVERENS